MKKINTNQGLKIGLLFSVIFLATSCYNYESQYEGEYSDEANNNVTGKLNKELVIVANGNVYLADRYGEELKKITTSGDVTIASINNEHSKVLFQRNGENIQIYEVSTEQIAGELTGTANAKWFDYHANNKTAYVLHEDGMLETFGPEILVTNPINLKTHLNIGAGNVNPTGVVVFEDGDIVYAYYSTSDFSYGLIYSNGANFIDSKSLGGTMEYMRINKDENRIWGTSTSGSWEYLQRYNFPSLVNFGFSAEEKLGIPTGSDSGYIVNDNDNIETPFGMTLYSPDGEITAIDY